MILWQNKSGISHDQIIIDKANGSLLQSISHIIVVVKADIRMPRIFGDHMVLQQDSQLSIWGWADPGEKVVVTLAGKKGKAVAGQDGKWKVSLKPIKRNRKGRPSR